MAAPNASPSGNPSRIRARTRRMRAVLAELRKRLPLRHRLEGGLGHGLMSAAAAVLAYLPPRALGLREGFWAAITAIAVVQTEFGATRSTARDQFTGAFVGGLIGVAVVLSVGQHLVTYALEYICMLYDNTPGNMKRARLLNNRLAPQEVVLKSSAYRGGQFKYNTAFAVEPL